MTKKILVFLCLLFVSCFTYAQKLHKEYYDNGQLKSVGQQKGLKKGEREIYSISSREGIKYEDEKKVGEWKFYYKNGQLSSIGSYRDEKRIGEWKFYYENGQLRSEGKFKNDKRIDAWKSYDKNGQLESIEKYENENVVELQEYYKNGKLKHITKYHKNGEFAGMSEYYKNGQLKAVAKYHNGRLTDIISYFDNRGNKLNKGTIKNGNGTVNNYDETGKLIGTIIYVNGEIKE